jgi:hypothetical protein
MAPTAALATLSDFVNDVPILRRTPAVRLKHYRTTIGGRHTDKLVNMSNR